ncbi:BON domain-containing protein [Pusillimonas sp. CC-YST705]|uniref:BON domain-containing protein n=1 Tax=Mesopusillimonas faecipullorum TaxID=2755040 RepID=A0ABS8CB26_9BURK|nr:BON domain-containing protein [Mesopusillimonas faecipullorum]MCB5363240.1 BON domain-containing protein [Mesopusillimonas faecipullorum]
MKFRTLLSATILGCGLALGGVAHANDDGKPAQSVGEYASDAAVTTKVKAAFVGQKELSALEISVETNNGVTTLSGTVGTPAEIELAERVAADVEGVKQVDNQLKVDPAKAN